MPEIKLHSPIAESRRRTREAAKQREHQLQLQLLRGQQEREDTRQRGAQQQQQWALRHLLGQNQAFGIDETLARERQITGEGRARAAEEQLVKTRPLNLKKLDITTQQLEDAENMLRIKRAIRAGQDPNTIKLKGVDDAPKEPKPGTKPRAAILGAIKQEEDGNQKRKRLIAEANFVTMKQAQEMVTEMSRALVALKGSRAGRRALKATGQRFETISGDPEEVRRTGATYKIIGPETKRKQKAPRKRRTKRGKYGEILGKPRATWALHRMDRQNKKYKANEAALKNRATAKDRQLLETYRKTQKDARKVSILLSELPPQIKNSEGVMVTNPKRQAVLQKYWLDKGYKGDPIAVYHDITVSWTGLLEEIAGRQGAGAVYGKPGVGEVAAATTVAGAQTTREAKIAEAGEIANAEGLAAAASRAGQAYSSVGGITAGYAEHKLKTWAQQQADARFNMKARVEGRMEGVNRIINSMKARIQEMTNQGMTKNQISQWIARTFTFDPRDKSYIARKKREFRAELRGTADWQEEMLKAFNELKQAYSSQRSRAYRNELRTRGLMN